jgi:hypothetical protein
MTLEQIKAEVAKLSPADQEKLTNHLNCRSVMRDPEWQRVMQEVSRRRAEDERARKVGARRRKAGTKAA